MDYAVQIKNGSRLSELLPAIAKALPGMLKGMNGIKKEVISLISDVRKTFTTAIRALKCTTSAILANLPSCPEAEEQTEGGENRLTLDPSRHRAGHSATIAPG